MEAITFSGGVAAEEDHEPQLAALAQLQASNRSVCFRAATCLVLIVVPIFIASTFITYFLMKNTSLGNQNYLHEYAIYAFIIFSVASVFPFGLFFLVVLIEKLHAKYRRHSMSSSSMSRAAEEETASFSANIFERQAEQDHMMMGHAIGHGHGRRARRGTLSRQDAFDCPPGYDELHPPPAAALPPSAAALQVVRDEQPPSYEMAIRCAPQLVVEGHSSWKSFARTCRVVYGDGEESPPAYDEKTMKS